MILCSCWLFSACLLLGDGRVTCLMCWQYVSATLSWCSCPFVRALTSFQEMRFEMRRKRMTFYPDAGCALSGFHFLAIIFHIQNVKLQIQICTMVVHSVSYIVCHAFVTYFVCGHSLHKTWLVEQWCSSRPLYSIQQATWQLPQTGAQSWVFKWINSLYLWIITEAGFDVQCCTLLFDCSHLPVSSLECFHVSFFSIVLCLPQTLSEVLPKKREKEWAESGHAAQWKLDF